MFALFWRKLPPVARRRFDGRVIPKFGTRLFLFFVTFAVSFGSYVMAFVTGSEWGVAYGKRCLSVCGMLTERLAALMAKAPGTLPARIGNGLVRLMLNDMAAVIMASFLLAMAVVVAVSLTSVLASAIKVLSGRDGSQAEVYDGSERIEGVRSDERERRRMRSWRPDVSGNPYSVRGA